MSKPVTTYQPRLVADEKMDLDEFTSRLLHLDNYCLTLNEVVNGWLKSRTAVMMAINTGRLIATKKDEKYKKPNSGTWIIERESVVALWGEQKHV